MNKLLKGMMVRAGAVKRVANKAAVAVGGAALVAASAAHAAGPDFTAITSAADFSTTSTSVGTVAAGIAGVVVLLAGAGFIIGAIRKKG